MIYHILQTRGGMEFSVGDDLRRYAIEVAIPKETKVWTMANGRKVETKVALFQGYIFAGFRYAPNWMTLRRIDGLVAPLGVDGIPTIVPADIVADAMRAETEVAKANAAFASKRALREGKGARVTKGMMISHIATIKKIIGKRAVCEFIGQSRPVSIALADLEAA